MEGSRAYRRGVLLGACRVSGLVQRICNFRVLGSVKDAGYWVSWVDDWVLGFRLQC